MSTTTGTEGHTIHWARLYDLGTSLFGDRYRSLHRKLVELAAIAPGQRVLDVGCGPGRLTLAAAAAAGSTGEALGIDASPEMVALATKNAARAGSAARFREAAIESLPAPDNHFDVALASLMIHHLPPELQRRGLAEVRRVLKPEGRLVVLEFSGAPGRHLGHLLWLLGLRRGSEQAEHLRALLAGAGFEAVAVELSRSKTFCFVHARKPAS